MFNKLSVLFYLIFSKTNAFIPNHNIVPRNTIIRRSHFSTIQTSFTDRDILFQTLKQLDYQVINNVENKIKKKEARIFVALKPLKVLKHI